MAPHVFVTAVHKVDPQNPTTESKHDAAIVWAEDVIYQGFRACVRELKNFDGIHRNFQVVSDCHSNKKHFYSIERYHLGTTNKLLWIRLLSSKSTSLMFGY